MYVKNSNFVMFLGLAAVVGFVVSLFAGNLGAEQGLTGGDISKASRYTNQKEDPAFTVIEEKLRNDEEFFNNTKGAMSFLQNRMEVLSELSEETLAACEGISEFEPLMEDLKSLNAKSFNTASAMENAGRSLDKIADGKNAPEYEVYSNMAYIGLGKVEAGMNFGRKFIDAVRDFFISKPVSEYQKLSDLASIWAVYCTEDAYLNSSEEDLELAFVWGGYDNRAKTGNSSAGSGSTTSKTDTLPGSGQGTAAPGNNGNNQQIHVSINLIANSALGEYINSLASSCENIRAAGSPTAVGVPVDLKNVAEEQLRNSLVKFISVNYRNSVSEQMFRNSAVEQVRISAKEAMRAAFPGEAGLWSALDPRHVEVD